MTSGIPFRNDGPVRKKSCPGNRSANFSSVLTRMSVKSNPVKSTHTTSPTLKSFPGCMRPTFSWRQTNGVGGSPFQKYNPVKQSHFPASASSYNFTNPSHGGIISSPRKNKYRGRSSFGIFMICSTAMFRPRPTSKPLMMC